MNYVECLSHQKLLCFGSNSLYLEYCCQFEFSDSLFHARQRFIFVFLWSFFILSYSRHFGEAPIIFLCFLIGLMMMV